jgi:uncharacterized protein YjcR
MTTKERCWKVAMYIYSGLPKEQVFTKLAEKYDIKPKTIKDNWRRRKKWLPEIFDINLDDAELALLDTIAGKKQTKIEFQKMARETSNENIRLGAFLYKF